MYKQQFSAQYRVVKGLADIDERTVEPVKKVLQANQIY